jgi:hypothetical protein
MTDDIFEPEVITDNPFPAEGSSIVSNEVSGSKSDSPSTIKEGGFPATKKIAYELLSSSLNTKSKKILGKFEFTESGAIQIGKYTVGVNGDIRITPTGITARDKSGITTFNLDADTGDANFTGTIQAGTIISGVIMVGDNNVIIDGENQRIIVNDGTNDRVLIGQF